MTNEIMTLYKEGFNKTEIANKLNLPLEEVEATILQEANTNVVYDSWQIEQMHWGAHY
ncbi:MAG: hypothetical protein ACO3UU_11190 [Minisyncoccia bacterium]